MARSARAFLAATLTMLVAAAAVHGSLPHSTVGAAAGSTCAGTLAKVSGIGSVKVPCDKVEVAFRFHVHEAQATDAFSKAQRWLKELSNSVNEVTSRQLDWNITSWEFDSELEPRYDDQPAVVDTVADDNQTAGGWVVQLLDRFTGPSYGSYGYGSSSARTVKYIFRFYAGAPVADADEGTLLAISDRVIAALQSLKNSTDMGVTDFGFAGFLDLKWSTSQEVVQDALKVARRQAMQNARTSAAEYADMLGVTVTDAALSAPLALEEVQAPYDPNNMDRDTYTYYGPERASLHAPLHDVISGVQLQYCFTAGGQGSA